MTNFREVTKRIVDLGVCLALIPFVIPVCAVLLVIIAIESPGAPLFVQRRLGRDGRPFHMLKLRTMQAKTGDLPSHQVSAASITRTGRWLRRLKLDELPQLFNVLSGAMSFVGPRPCLITQDEVIRARQELGVLKYRPGITGPAQLAGVDFSRPGEVAKLEAGYFPHATLWTDLRMMVRTVIGQGSGDAVLKRR